MAEQSTDKDISRPEDDGYDTTASTLAVPEKGDQIGSDQNSMKAASIEKPDVEAAETPETPEEPLKRTLTGYKFFLFMASVLSSTFLFSLDNTVVADVQGIVADRFDAIDKLPWFSTGFALGAMATTLVFGKLYSQFDAKWLYVATVVLFELGSVLCAAAPNSTCFIVGRAIAGLGGMGMYIGVMTLIAYTTTMQERSIYIGLTGLVWGAGTVLGPVIGGAFADSSATWRWGFYINLCVGGAFAPVYLFLIPSSDPRPGVSFMTRIKHIDVVGTILFIGATVSFVMAVCFGGILYDWDSGKMIALWVVMGVLYITLGIQQTRTIFTNKIDRMFPVEFFTAKYNKEILILFASIAAGSTIAFTPLYMIPLYFQFTRADGALEAGVRLLPLICTMVFFCIANGGIMAATGYYMPWYLFGGILGMIGGVLFFTVVETDTSTSKIYGYSVLIGIGSGSFIQASFSVAQAIVEPHNIPNAVGFISLGQVSGLTIALAIVNSVLINGAQDRLIKILPNLSKDAVQGAIAGVNSNIFDGLDPEKQREVLDAIVKSISDTYGTTIAAGALVIVMSVFMSRQKLFLQAGQAG